ncbi:MAG TPA: hypothetical protein VKV40_18565 [Ktedonobacteraceae bacterium]|nr:hypothetical protein [Ktedonobacteraceae bacterium]
MSKYRRWQRPDSQAPAWLLDRQAERMHAPRPAPIRLAGLCCQECLEPVSQAHFLSYEGLCARCWEVLHSVLLEGSSMTVVVVSTLEEGADAGLS